MGDSTVNDNCEMQTNLEISEDKILNDPPRSSKEDDKEWILKSSKINDNSASQNKLINEFNNIQQNSALPTVGDEKVEVGDTNYLNINVKNVYKCSKCNYSTRKKKKLRIHLKLHEDQNFQCDICKKEFSKLNTLKRHQLTHTNRKYFLCDLCGRSYLHSISLKYHKLGHLKHNPIAGERTKMIQEKIKRIANKTEEKSKKYLCDLCGRVFKQAVSLKSHYLKHNQDSSTIENKNNLASDFDYEAYLNKKRPGPKRKHPLVTEKKRFKCSECPYAAVRSRDVVVHLRTHTGEKPFPCNICGKYFSKESVVERHKLIHGTLKYKNQNVDLPKILDSDSSAQKSLSAYHDKNLQLFNDFPSNRDSHEGKTFTIKNETNLKEETKFKYPYFDNCDMTMDSFNRLLIKYDTDRQQSDINTSQSIHSGSFNGPNVIKHKLRHKKSLEKLSEHQHNRNLNLQNNKYLQTVNDFYNSTKQSTTVNSSDQIDNTHLVMKETNNLVQNSLSNANLDGNYGKNSFSTNGTLNSCNSLKELKENVDNATERTPHVIRIDGKEIHSTKKDKKTTKLVKEKTETTKRVKGVKKKHKCEECSYETFLSRDMRVHMRKHSGERPFPCPICGKRFTKESVVKRHQSVHTGLRPYSCEYCFKTFSQQSNLKTHKIAHFDVTTGLLKNNTKTYKKENVLTEEISNQDTKDDVNVDMKYENNSNDEDAKKINEIEMINVNEIKSEVNFELKTENCSSDDECLSTIKESIMEGIKDKGDEGELFLVKEELNDDWQNENHSDVYEDVDELKENNENIQQDTNVQNKDTDAERLERKKRKKFKKKMKKLKEKKAKMKNKYELYDDLVSQKINDGEKVLFKCNECHYSVVNKRDLIVHMRSHSGEKLFSCDICMKKFSKQSVVNRHKLIHFGIRPFTCHLCGMTFTQSNSLKKHVEIKHGVEEKDLPFKCDMCTATFAQEKSLKTHKHAHLRKKNNEFTCHVCGKVFPHECRLKSHLLLHEERQFNCAICSKKFLRKYDLKYHLMVHTQEKQCMCHICGGSFSTPATLKMHLRSHSTFIEYHCTICNEGFSKSNELTQHKITVHKEVKSFQCLMCDKFFTQASGLKKHQITHSTSRPHQCLICSKRFKLLGHLHKHYNTTKHGSINGEEMMKNSLDTGCVL